MDSTKLHDLNKSMRQISTDLRRISSLVKRCRAGDQALHGLASLNGTSDALVLTVSELRVAADELAREARQYAKSVSDLSLAFNTTSVPALEEM